MRIEILRAHVLLVCILHCAHTKYTHITQAHTAERERNDSERRWLPPRACASVSVHLRPCIWAARGPSPIEPCSARKHQHRLGYPAVFCSNHRALSGCSRCSCPLMSIAFTRHTHGLPHGVHRARFTGWFTWFRLFIQFLWRTSWRPIKNSGAHMGRVYCGIIINCIVNEL